MKYGEADMNSEHRRVCGDESVGRLPQIYCFVNGRVFANDLSMVAISEDGEYLAGHCSSSESFGWHDIGMHEHNWKHEHYLERYPGGFVLVWVPREQVKTHAGLLAAIAKNAEAGEAGTPWERERAASKAAENGAPDA